MQCLKIWITLDYVGCVDWLHRIRIGFYEIVLHGKQNLAGGGFWAPWEREGEKYYAKASCKVEVDSLETIENQTTLKMENMIS